MTNKQQAEYWKERCLLNEQMLDLVQKLVEDATKDADSIHQVLNVMKENEPDGPKK